LSSLSPYTTLFRSVLVPCVLRAEQRLGLVRVHIGDEEQRLVDGAEAADLRRRVRIEVDLVVTGLAGVDHEGVGRSALSAAGSAVARRRTTGESERDRGRSDREAHDGATCASAAKNHPWSFPCDDEENVGADEPRMVQGRWRRRRPRTPLLRNETNHVKQFCDI